MSRDDNNSTRQKILSRRAKFVAVALAGIACGKNTVDPNSDAGAAAPHIGPPPTAVDDASAEASTISDEDARRDASAAAASAQPCLSQSEPPKPPKLQRRDAGPKPCLSPPPRPCLNVLPNEPDPFE